MAKSDMYLRIEGKSHGVIKGESTNATHAEEIEVLDWSWGMTGPSALSGAGPSSRVALSELRITKGVDRASTALMVAMRGNETIKKAVLTVCKSGSMPPLDFLVITIERGRVTKFDIGVAAPGSPELVEHLALAFESIDVTYCAQDGKGAKTAVSTFHTTIS